MNRRDNTNSINDYDNSLKINSGSNSGEEKRKGLEKKELTLKFIKGAFNV